MDWKHTCCPITKYTFPLVPSPLQIENIMSSKEALNSEAVLATKAMVDLTREVASSTVDHSDSTM